MPITPENLQAYLVPSISGTHLPTGTITPMQQFISNSGKSKNKEPKYNRSQPDHLDPQSVLRTRTRHVYKSNVLLLSYFPLVCLYWLLAPSLSDFYDFIPEKKA